MNLQIATKGYTLSEPFSGLAQTHKGPVAFQNRNQRQALANTMISKLAKANGLYTTRLSKLSALPIGFQSNKHKLQKIKTLKSNNSSQVQLALDGNQQEREKLEAQHQRLTTALQENQQKLKTDGPEEREKTSAKIQANTQDLQKIELEKQHLQEDDIQIQKLADELTDNELLIGFMGESQDSIIYLAGGRNKSFGQHGFAIIQDTQTGKVYEKAVETARLKETLEASDTKISQTLPALFRAAKPKTHEHNTKLAQQIAPQSSVLAALFGTKNTQTTGAESAGAACCSITSLDELANVGQRTNHDHGEIITPKTPGEAGLTAFVTYASAAGIKIAGDIYANFNAITKDIAIAEQTLDLAQLENEAKLQDPANSAEKEALTACRSFIKQQKSEAQFQKRVAGILSGVGSLSILVGQFVAKVSPVGLYLLSCFGAGHVVHMGRQLKKACQDYKTSEPQSAEKHHFYKKIKNLALAFISWSAYTAGTATLGTMSLGMMGITIKTGLAPALTIAGIAALGVGIAGSVVYNNIVSSKRFYPGMPMLGRLDVRNPPTKDQVEKKIQQAQTLRKVAKQYRATTFEQQQRANPLGVAKHHGLRYANKLGLYTTLGLYPAPFMAAKFKIKGQRAGLVEASKVQNQAREQAMQSLFDIPLQEAAKEEHQSIEASRAECKALMQNVSTDSSDRTQQVESLHNLFDALNLMPNGDQVMKLLAKKITTEHTQIRTKIGGSEKNGVLGQFIPEKETTTWFKPVFERLFVKGDGKQLKPASEPIQQDNFSTNAPKILAYTTLDGGITGNIGALLNTPACCPAQGFAKGLSFNVLDQITKTSLHAQEDIAVLQDILLQSVDQYLLYQARNNAKEDIALYSNYKKSFENPKA